MEEKILKHFEDWSRNDKLAAISIFVGIIGVTLTVFQVQGTRHSSTAAASDAMPVSSPASTTVPLEIKVFGNGNQFTTRFLTGSTDSAAMLAKGFETRGNGGEQTLYLRKAQRVHFSLFGNGNTLFISKEVKTQVSLSDFGNANKTKALP